MRLSKVFFVIAKKKNSHREVAKPIIASHDDQYLIQIFNFYRSITTNSNCSL